MEHFHTIGLVMTSNPQYDCETTATEVAKAFAAEVREKTGRDCFYGHLASSQNQQLSNLEA